MPTIDIHPHIISDDQTRYPRAPLKGKQSQWSKERSVGFEQMLSEMDATGVDRSILVQSSTCYGFDNSYVGDAIAAHPDRLGGVCSIDALTADAPATLKGLVARGFSGVRLYVSGATVVNEETWFSEPVSYPFWSAAADLGIPVCLQVNWKTLDQVGQVLDRFSNMKVILDHLSRPPIDDGPPYKTADPLFRLSNRPNVYLKLTPVNIKDAGQGAATPQSLVNRLVEVFGANRIAWGSNFPSSTTSLKEAYTIVADAAMELSEADRALLFGGTAAELYPAKS